LNYEGKHCVVVGGGGAIGSNLVRRLLNDGASVVVLDDFSSGFQWLLPQHQKLKVRLFDIAEPNAEGPLRGFITKGSVVFHLAAHFANANSVEHPVKDTLVNVVGTVRVLTAAAQRKAERVVFASAGCAAGHEDTPYQCAKSAGEAYCRYFHKEVPTVVCRFHNSYGPGEVPGAWRNVIPNWIYKAMKNEPLTVFGDGTDARDFIYVDDLVSMMVAAEPSPVPYTLGTGTLTRTKDLAEMIISMTGSGSALNFRPRRRWDHKGTAAEHVYPMSHVPLAQGLWRTYAWFKENKAKIAESARW
jgi:UDP-glucose 4-epimerase